MGCDINRYYSQFNYRAWDIDREKRGIVLCKGIPEEERDVVVNSYDGSRYSKSAYEDEFFVEGIVDKL